MIVNDGGGGSSTASNIGAAVGRAVVGTAKRVAPRRGRGTAVRQQTRYRSSTSSNNRNYSSRNSSRSSGGGGGGGGGGRVYSPPKPPSLASYLGTDAIYQQAVRGGKRSLVDYLSELTRRRGEAGTQFNQTMGSMERDRVQQLEDLRNEFASRGLIQSGLYGEEQGKFQQKFAEQQTALKQQQAALLADLLSQEKNYRRENDLTLEQAKQDALMRRAQKFNIGG